MSTKRIIMKRPLIIFLTIFIAILSCSDNHNKSNKQVASNDLNKSDKNTNKVPNDYVKTDKILNPIKIPKYAKYHRPKKLYSNIPKTAFQALEQSKTFHFLTLIPGGPIRTTNNNIFLHSHKILGWAVIKDKSIRMAILNNLYRNIESHDDKVADCFIPRHGIRVDVGGITWDWVICFECQKIRIYTSNCNEYYIYVKNNGQFFNQIARMYGLKNSSKRRKPKHQYRKEDFEGRFK